MRAQYRQADEEAAFEQRCADPLVLVMLLVHPLDTHDEAGFNASLDHEDVSEYDRGAQAQYTSASSRSAAEARNAEREA